MKVGFVCSSMAALFGISLCFAQTSHPNVKRERRIDVPPLAIGRIGDRWFVRPSKVRPRWAVALPGMKSKWSSFKMMPVPVKPDPDHPPMLYVDPRSDKGFVYLVGGAHGG